MRNRIESAQPRLQAMLATTYISGYRIGMIMAGAIALSLAEGFGSTADSYSYLAWQKTYFIMAGVMLVGVVTTLLIREPTVDVQKANFRNRDYVNFIGVFFSLDCLLCFSFLAEPIYPRMVFWRQPNAIQVRLLKHGYAGWNRLRVCVRCFMR